MGLSVFFSCFSMYFCRIKEKFPYAFDDICLYSEVSHLLAHCMFRLTSRRFIQELFQDVQFMPVSPSVRWWWFAGRRKAPVHTFLFPPSACRCTKKRSRSWKSYQNPWTRTSTLLRSPDRPPSPSFPAQPHFLPSCKNDSQKKKKTEFWLWPSGWGCFCCA